MAANHTTTTPSSKKSTQYILLSVFAILVILMYCLIFCTGGGKGTPKLGIDLQGGTRVTLTPSGNPSDDQLKQAQTILMNRVNGMGVSGAEVQIDGDGDNLVITVPGSSAEDARNLGTTAKLVVRPVMEALGPDNTQVDQQPKVKDKSDETSVDVRKREIEALREFRQAPLNGEDGKPLAADQQLRILRENASKMTCQKADRFAGNDDPSRPLVTCDSQGQKYILGPAPLIDPNNPNGSRLDGSFIKADTVEGGFNNQQGHTYVSFSFKGKGVDTWARVTSTYTGKQVAMVPCTIDKKYWCIRRSVTSSGWNEVAKAFPCLTATGLVLPCVSVTVQRISTAFPTFSTQGARIKTPLNGFIPSGVIVKSASNESTWRPNALRRTVVSIAPKQRAS